MTIVAVGWTETAVLGSIVKLSFHVSHTGQKKLFLATLFVVNATPFVLPRSIESSQPKVG
jgi:hypothetical protein